MNQKPAPELHSPSWASCPTARGTAQEKLRARSPSSLRAPNSKLISLGIYNKAAHNSNSTASSINYVYTSTDLGLSSKTPAILEAGRTPRELQEKMQARNIASSLENGAGKRRRRRCENFSYQFEVLNAADEIRRIRPATFNIYAIFKKQDFKIMEINFCASKKDHKNRINSKQPMLRKSHHFICIPCNLFQV